MTLQAFLYKGAVDKCRGWINVYIAPHFMVSKVIISPFKHGFCEKMTNNNEV